MNNGKSIRYFESPYYPILLNSFYFSIFALYKSVIGPHLKLHMSDDMQNWKHYEFSRFTDFWYG